MGSSRDNGPQTVFVSLVVRPVGSKQLAGPTLQLTNEGDADLIR